MPPLASCVPRVFASLLLVLLSSCSQSELKVEATSIKPVADRQTAPDFSLKDEDGRPVKLSDYRGKVVLLNFWATWCGPCKLEVPWFTEFERTYKDRQFAVIGVSMDEGGWEDVRPFLQRLKVNYRIVLGDNEVASLYGGVEAIPTSFMIDREGRIASVHVGLVSKGDYVSDIENLLD